MSKLLLVAVALALVFASTGSAQKSTGSCSVTPTTAVAGQPFTITVTANVLFDYDLTSPSGTVYTGFTSQPGEVITYQYTTTETGTWTAGVNALQGRSWTTKKRIASCPFTVTT